VTGHLHDGDDAAWLGPLIAALPDEPPPAGWEAGVRTALATERRMPASVRRRWLPGPTAALAFAAAAAVLLQAAPVPRRPLDDGGPSIRVVRGEGARGDGADAALGDTLHVEAPTGGELRIYRDDRDVVLRCIAGACTSTPGRVIAELRLSAPGVYRAVVLLPDAGPAIPMTGTLAGDADACRCTARTSVPIIAR
jgi:hypothetical protein